MVVWIGRTIVCVCAKNGAELLKLDCSCQQCFTSAWLQWVVPFMDVGRSRVTRCGRDVVVARCGTNFYALPAILILSSPLVDSKIFFAEICLHHFKIDLHKTFFLICIKSFLFLAEEFEFHSHFWAEILRNCFPLINDNIIKNGYRCSLLHFIYLYYSDWIGLFYRKCWVLSLIYLRNRLIDWKFAKKIVASGRSERLIPNRWHIMSVL